MKVREALRLKVELSGEALPPPSQRKIVIAKEIVCRFNFR